jgi:hypothetical protein
MKSPVNGLKVPINLKKAIITLVLSFSFVLSAQSILHSEDGGGASKDVSPKPILAEAVMCEEIVDGRPFNQTILFSLERGKVLCFTTFGEIPEHTTIFHKWYFKDKLIYKIKLVLKPPRWSTYSSIKLRDTDRGPWRVEIIDQQNNLYKTLRFSVAD